MPHGAPFPPEAVAAAFAAKPQSAACVHGASRSVQFLQSKNVGSFAAASLRRSCEARCAVVRHIILLLWASDGLACGGSAKSLREQGFLSILLYKRRYGIWNRKSLDVY